MMTNSTTNKKKNKVIAIVGATASGKTSYAINLAKEIGLATDFRSLGIDQQPWLDHVDEIAMLFHRSPNIRSALHDGHCRAGG